MVANQYKTFLYIFLYLALLIILAGCKGPQEIRFTGTDVTGIDINDEAVLMDHNGRETKLQDFKDKAIILFFGFTSCPDVCPNTLAKFDLVVEGLGEKADKVRVIFVSLDPERDSPDILKTYVTSFNNNFIGLTGTESELSKLAKSYKIFYQKSFEADGGYTIDHFSGAYLIDNSGRPRVLIGHAQAVGDIVNDVLQILGS